jgi:hypothetical protein
LALYTTNRAQVADTAYVKIEILFFWLAEEEVVEEDAVVVAVMMLSPE